MMMSGSKGRVNLGRKHADEDSRRQRSVEGPEEATRDEPGRNLIRSTGFVK